jgi:transposase
MVPRNLTEQQRDARLGAVLTSKCMTMMLQPPYSPDLTPCEFFLSQKLKTAMKGHHFESTENIQKPVTQVLNDIPQNAFQECYKQ